MVKYMKCFLSLILWLTKRFVSFMKMYATLKQLKFIASSGYIGDTSKDSEHKEKANCSNLQADFFKINCRNTLTNCYTFNLHICGKYNHLDFFILPFVDSKFCSSGYVWYIFRAVVGNSRFINQISELGSVQKL